MSTIDPLNSFTFDTPDILDKFRAWLDHLVAEEKPDLIVAQARGCVRLVQIAWQQTEHPPIVSELALPFMESSVRGVKVLLIDDSIIFGSSFAKTYGYLTTLTSDVVGAVFAVDRQNFLGHRPSGFQGKVVRSKYADLPIRWAEALWPKDIRLHHASIVRNVARNCLDYNLDFATVQCRLAPFRTGDIPFIIHRLKNLPMIRAAHDVTPAWSSSVGIHRYTLFLNDDLSMLGDLGSLKLTSSPKIRCTIAPSLGQIHLTPIVQLCASATIKLTDHKFADKLLMQMLNNLDEPAADGLPEYARSTLRLLTAAITARLAQDIAHGLSHVLSDHLQLEELLIEKHDLAHTVGFFNSTHLTELCHMDDTESVCLLQYSEPVNSYQSAPESSMQQLLINGLEDNPHLAPHSDDLLHEAVGKLFLLLRLLTDSTEARLRVPNASRLEVGITATDISQLLDRQGISPTADDISLALDICVDNGLAVPRFIVDNDLCFRAFYSGEDEDDQNTLQLKAVIYEAYSHHIIQARRQPMKPYDLNKVAAYAKEIHIWLPIKPNFSNFGRVSDISIDQTTVDKVPDGTVGDFDICDWITGENSGALDLTPKDKGGYLLPREGFRTVVEDTWTRDMRGSLKMTLIYAIRLFTHGNVNRNISLLLSTCPTQRHAYNAFAIELYNWSTHSRRSFVRAIETLITGLNAITSGRTTEFGKGSFTPLYWNTQYVIEARKKHHVFHNEFLTLQEQLAEITTLKTEPLLQDWWNDIGSRILDPSIDEEADQRFKRSWPLMICMEELTRIAVVALNDAGFSNDVQSGFSANDRPDYSKPMYRWLKELSLSECISRYNRAVRKLNVTVEQQPKTLSDSLALIAGSKTNRTKECSQLFEACIESAKAINSLVEHYVPRYTTECEGFPFLPDNVDVRVREDGVEERVLDQMFVLMCHVQANEAEVVSRCQQEMNATFENYRNTYGIIYGKDETGLLSIAVCQQFDVMTALCGRLSRIATTIGHGDRFSGISKALGFGSCLALKRGGEVTIVDQSVPSLLWELSTMSQMLIKKYPDARLDARLIISKRACHAADFQNHSTMLGSLDKIDVVFEANRVECSIVNVSK